MNLPDVVQAAVASKIEAELKPMTDRVSRLRATLDAYEVRARADVERRVSNAMLVALGGAEVAADPAFMEVTNELRTSLEAVEELVAPRPEPEPEQAQALPASQAANVAVTAPVPCLVVAISPNSPAPSLDQQTITASVPRQPTPEPRRARTEDVEHATRLITEVETLKSEFGEQHQARLYPLLQAATAEVRLLLTRLPEDHSLAHRLGSLIPLLHAIKNDAGITEFVKGLTYGQSGDWVRLSSTSRKRVADYDRDVAATERPATPPSGKSSTKASPGPERPANGHQWPSLPKLNGLTKPILLAGGLVIPEKLKSVRERFGITVEWHEIEHDNPRSKEALLQRIKAGKVGAIVLLEGVMGHSTSKPVIDVCTTNHVPYAMGDKAGVASLQSAFSELERKLSLC